MGRGRKENQRLSLPYLTGTDFLQPGGFAQCLWLRVSCDSDVLAPGLAIPTSPFLLDRVQREQLAAIFRLMKEKSDTFGEMSEGDMKEQLRLYDI